MGKSIFSPTKWEEWGEKRARAIWINLQTNYLWQRMLKVTLATTITVIIAIIPSVVEVYGRAAYLAPMTTVFGHPGRRFGMMAEALVLAVSGAMLAVAWSMLALYLSSLVYDDNPQAAYTIRGIFLTVALMFHGYLRSHTPRLFLFVLLLVIVCCVSMTGTATAVTSQSVTILVYPILTAAAVLLLVNTLVFPEFSSSFLGITTIETLGETVGALRDAGRYFIASVEGSEAIVSDEKSDVDGADGADLYRAPTLAEKPSERPKEDGPTFRQKFISLFRKSKSEDPGIAHPKASKAPEPIKLKTLTDKKAKLRAKLASCKDAQTECNFELAWAVLPPKDLKPISDIEMRKLVANTISLIGACESKYALMGDESDKKETETKDQAQLKSVAEAANLDTTEGEDSSRANTDVEDLHDHSDSGERRPTRKERRRQKKRRRKDRKKSKTRLEEEAENLEIIKPRKEIEFGDVDLLKYLVQRIAKPLSQLQEKIDRSVDVVSTCLAYCYEVPKLPSGIRAPNGIQLEEIDIRVDILIDALASFDRDSAAALEGAGALHDLGGPQVDLMPRMETFLISSFLLNLRQSALHTLEMLRHSRSLIEKHQARHGRHRIWVPSINWKKWLQSGGEQDRFALPDNARKDARTGNKKNDPADDEDSPVASNETLLAKKDIESASEEKQAQLPKAPKKTVSNATSKSKNGTLTFRLRNGLADLIEFLVGSDDVLYAIKLTVAMFLVLWPAFVAQWNTWYSLNRGIWAALQLVVISEVAIGTSVMTFILRGAGTIAGCVWGYAAYQARDGNRVVCVVMIAIGIIPSTYIQLGSEYVKAGMISIISMCVVVLATADDTVAGSATENFLKRLIAFLIGGVVALLVQFVLFPVKARDRLVESLAASIRQISEMEACLAYGIESETNVDVHSLAVTKRFSQAKAKAEGALTAAEAFLPFCAKEPRLKGSFAPLALVYGEILYVLHAIVDRMENMLCLRYEYGSGVLEEYNAQVYAYRRNVAGSITLVLFAVHEALTTKLPLPQFLPSARLAHLRMINRVREVVQSSSGSPDRFNSERSDIEISMVKRIVRQKFLSWNAASAGQVEVIEYLEELIDLVKLLVGANEFRSGLLTRGSYREWVSKIQRPGTVESQVVPPSTGGSGDKSTLGKPASRTDKERMEHPDPPNLQSQAPPNEPPTRKTGLTKRRQTFSNTRERIFGPSAGHVAGQGERSEEAEVEAQRKGMEEELPRVLQRVRTRRVEEMEMRGRRGTVTAGGAGAGVIAEEGGKSKGNPKGRGRVNTML